MPLPSPPGPRDRGTKSAARGRAQRPSPVTVATPCLAILWVADERDSFSQRAHPLGYAKDYDACGEVPLAGRSARLPSSMSAPSRAT